MYKVHEILIHESQPICNPSGQILLAINFTMNFYHRFVILTTSTHPKCKSRGSCEKFRKFATKWAQEFAKVLKKWLR